MGMNGNAALTVKINHKKAVTYEKNEWFDEMKTTGAATVESALNAQGVYGRAFWTGETAGPGGGQSGTSMADLAAVFSTTSNQKRKVKSTHLRMRLISATTGLQNLTVYILRCNRDAGSGTANAVWPSQAWGEAAGEVPTQAPTTYGATPYLPAFGSLWKIIKTKKFVLNPGQSVNVNVDTNEHWAMNPATVGAAIESANMMCLVHKRTYGILIVNSGFPVNDSVNNDLVGAGTAKVNLIWDWKVKSSVVLHTTKTANIRTNTLDAMSAAILTQREVNDDAGAVQDHMIS